MDLVYMPEVLTYGSLRAPIYRDYEQPWNKDYFNYGKVSCTTTQLQREQYQHQLQKMKSGQKEHCQLCRDSKKRSLSAYIRGKTRTTSCSEIHEEEESEETPEESRNEKEEKKTEKLTTKPVKKTETQTSKLKVSAIN